MKCLDTLFFVHIPKTAGTSFRVAAHNFFGFDNIIADYGSFSDHTTPAVMQAMYEEEDPFSLYVHMRENDIKMLTGHVNLMRYSILFSTLQVTTFLRHPVSQVLSHYSHYSRHHNYEGSLDEFINESRFANMQSRALGSLPIELLGFVGITEKYNDSIDIFNDCYGVEFEKLSLNTKAETEGEAPSKQPIDVLDDEMKAKIVEINHLDMEKYEKAVVVFNERLRLHKLGLSYDYAYAHIVNNTKVWGVAFSQEQDKALNIEVLKNGEVVDVVTATEARPHMRNFNTPRLGFVGFSYVFPKALKKGDQLICRVQGTEQIILKEDI